MRSTALVVLLALAAGLTACETRRTTRGGSAQTNYSMQTDPFAGARLRTGTEYREVNSSGESLTSDYFRTPDPE